MWLTKTYTNIRSQVLWFGLLLPLIAVAHSTSQSSTLLIEDASGKWTLQVRGALTAFQYMVENKYTKDGYATPEEFRRLMLELLGEHINLSIDDENVILNNGQIRLGHEGIVVYEVDVPNKFESIKIENTFFQAILNSKSNFMVLKSGVNKKMFALDGTSDYAAHLEFKNNGFVELVEAKNNSTRFINRYILMAILLGVVVFGIVVRKLKSYSEKMIALN